MEGCVRSADEIEPPQRLSGLQVRVIALCALVAALDGFDIQVVSYVAPAVSRAWQIPSAAFGVVFTLGLLGVVAGQLFLAPLADRVGRKPVILWSTLAFGLLSLSSILVTSPSQLAFIRFMTGLGLGAAMPNIIALTAEYSPPRIRSTCIVLMFAGTPLGGTISSYVSSTLISEHGWQSAFLVGGSSPSSRRPFSRSPFRNRSSSFSRCGETRAQASSPIDGSGPARTRRGHRHCTSESKQDRNLPSSCFFRTVSHYAPYSDG